MPLVPAKDVLQKAMLGGYAVAAFNVYNLEIASAITECAEDEDSPVIILISPGAIKYAGLEPLTVAVQALIARTPVPVVIQLDHGTDLAQNVRCLRAGFSSLMYDGSTLSLEDNMAITARVTEMAHAVGVSVEAELGRIPRIEQYESLLTGYDYTTKLPREAQAAVDQLMARPEDVERFVEETQCDSIAVAIGSVHGMRRSVQPLDIGRLDAIRAKARIPMVLHGASGVICTRLDAEELGIPLEDHDGTIEDAIRRGISKVNVGTELSMAFLQGISDALKANPSQKDLRKVLLPGRELAKEKIRYYMRLFGSSGKAGTAGKPAEFCQSRLSEGE